MDWFVRAFVKASVSWLALGVTLGVAMAVEPAWTIYRTAHLHINLLGFVAMMIFGVAYHVMPRFAGTTLHDRRLAGIHWWVANAGLALLVTGFVLRYTAGVPAGWSVTLLAAGGGASALGAYAFAYNIWRTLDAGARSAAATVSRTAERSPLVAMRRS
jgi:cbb3-type cytochrome oxidase subunit 1